MKILKNLICLITALAVAAAFCSCSVQKKQDPIEDPQPADDSQQDETEVTEEYYEPYIIGSPMPEPFGEDYVSDGDYNLYVLRCHQPKAQLYKHIVCRARRC